MKNVIVSLALSIIISSGLVSCNKEIDSIVKKTMNVEFSYLKSDENTIYSNVITNGCE